MEVAAPAAAPAQQKKAKAAKPKVAKKIASHPSYQEMIKKAVESLKERSGSSRQAIQKYIQATFKTCDDKASQAHLRIALKRGVEHGLLKRVKGTGASGSFRLAQKVAKPTKPKVTKKPKATKPKATKPKAVKPAGEKKAAKPAKVSAKPKKAVAEKKASKPKVAKKPKTPKKAVKPVAKKAATPKAKKPAAKKAPAKK